MKRSLLLVCLTFSVAWAQPTYTTMHDRMVEASRQLTGDVRAALPNPPARVEELLAQMDTLDAALNEKNSVATKLEYRHVIWYLRQELEKLGPEAQTPKIREDLEEARSAALDIGWEGGEHGYPFGEGETPSATWIPNYVPIEEGFARGGQPVQPGVEWLAEHGVKTEIDLRGDGDLTNQWLVPDWHGRVQRVSIPFEDYKDPTLEQVEQFIALVDNPANRPVYVHCKAGVGRTGVMMACWRVAHGATAEEAIATERRFSYENKLAQEHFVREFEKYWREKHPQTR